MKTQTAVILWVCVAFGVLSLCVCGLVSSYLTSQLIAQKNRRVMLVVAKHNYPKGTAITNAQDVFELRDIRETDAPSGYLTEVEKLNRMILNQDILEGEPITISHLKDQNRVSLYQVVPVGKAGSGRQLILVIGEGREELVRVGTHIDVIEKQN